MIWFDFYLSVAVQNTIFIRADAAENTHTHKHTLSLVGTSVQLEWLILVKNEGWPVIYSQRYCFHCIDLTVRAQSGEIVKLDFSVSGKKKGKKISNDRVCPSTPRVSFYPVAIISLLHSVIRVQLLAHFDFLVNCPPSCSDTRRKSIV